METYMKDYFHLRVRLVTLAIALVGMFMGAGFASASDTGWLENQSHPAAKARLGTGQTDPAQKTIEGFLEVDLDQGWKTYWRSPGEGGIAPSIDWGQSTNISRVEWHWPYPQQFSLLGLHTLGYQGDTVIPITMHVEDWTQPVHINAEFTLSSCTTICVLTEYPISLAFNPGGLVTSEEDMFTYAQAISKVPKPSPQLSDVTAHWDAEKQLLVVKLTKDSVWKKPEVIVDGKTEESQEYSYKPEDTYIKDNQLTATFAVSSWLGDINFGQQSVYITVKDDAFLAEESVSVQSGVVSALTDGLTRSSLFQMLLFALLGGLILNVMPCVLPVLGMKLSSIVSAQGLERRQIRGQFLASSAGIWASFMLLASFLLVLKWTGSAVGWGIQFQSPWFIGLMVLVTGLFGANMLGLFEITLSSNTSTWMASKGGHSYTGHFVQGMFATLLATPCSAPFLGTAIAFALATSSVEMFGIFTALAVGMALPWIVVALFPGLANFMPKPGVWMNRVKYLFGGMMLATSLWLLSLLSNHLSLGWMAVACLVFVGVLVYSIRKVYDSRIAFSAALVMVCALALLFLIRMLPGEDIHAKRLPWQPLSQELIDTAVSQGETVFVDVTADWCVTCKANKIGVILQDPVYSTLKNGEESGDIVLVQGDWTRPNTLVTDYLRSHGRYGVPFNIVYGPGAPQGVELPVILTRKLVMDAIKTAQGKDG